MKKLLRFALMFILIFALVMLAESVILPALSGSGQPAATAAIPAESPAAPPESAPEAAPPDELAVDEDGEYTSKDELALYIHLYGHLPANYITKAEAEAAGWTGGAVGKVLPGKSIGGDRFYNREGLLPKAPGRVWTECDVGERRSTRGAERIVFSNDGLIYYSPDHYDSFELLYGEP
ncbi:MAG: ribonuclease [Oscillospiraceae bacterium]|nr:ribonuclease [Oscillospiraceae bacterium]